MLIQKEGPLLAGKVTLSAVAVKVPLEKALLYKSLLPMEVPLCPLMKISDPVPSLRLVWGAVSVDDDLPVIEKAGHVVSGQERAVTVNIILPFPSASKLTCCAHRHSAILLDDDGDDSHF